MSWTGKKDFKMLRVDADFFENGRKKSSVSKNIRIRVDGAIVCNNKATTNNSTICLSGWITDTWCLSGMHGCGDEGG